MEKEKVLEIEAQEVFDRVAIRIKYQNFEVLKRGEFEDREIGVVSFNNPCYLSYPYNQLHLKGKFKIDDDFIFTVTKEEFENIKNMVEAINEKYGIPKRWRAETEIRDKLKEYEENIEFLETSLKDKEIIQELKRESIILKWVLGEIEKI